jgi:hypothetical protein
MSLKDPKPAVKSPGIWGSVLSVLPLFYLLEKALDLPTGIIDRLVEAGNGAYLAIMAFVGLALQVYDIVKDSGPVRGLFKVKE